MAATKTSSESMRNTYSACPAGAEELVQVGDGHDVPARLLRAHRRVEDRPPVHHGGEVPAVQGQDVGDALRFEVAVDELLPRGGRRCPRRG